MLLEGNQRDGASRTVVIGVLCTASSAWSRIQAPLPAGCAKRRQFGDGCRYGAATVHAARVLVNRAVWGAVPRHPCRGCGVDRATGAGLAAEAKGGRSASGRSFVETMWEAKWHAALVASGPRRDPRRRRNGLTSDSLEVDDLVVRTRAALPGESHRPRLHIPFSDGA